MNIKMQTAFKESPEWVGKGHDDLLVWKEAWKLSQVQYIIHLSSSLTQHSINKGHDGCFQVDLVSVPSRTPVQIVYKRLKGWQVITGV